MTSTAGEQVRAFVPPPFPLDPPLALSRADLDLMELANRALGRLDGLFYLLPNTSLFVYMYVRKEALLSSQIEGTQSSLSDLLRHEVDAAPGVPVDDVAEVSNYIRAMEHGLERLRDGCPLSLRLLREIHERLLAGGRGARQQPGAFRRSQNWIGGSRPGLATFVPPPPEHVQDCLGNLETFLHDEPRRTPLLIKAALAHARFETIHPFLDGNGRLGRLLITLLLCSEGALEQPTLYLSLYLKTNRQAYYEHLQRVRTDGDWEGWVRFFLQGVLDVAGQAVETARRLLALFEADRLRLQDLGRAAGSALRIHEALQRHPILSVKRGCDLTGLTDPTVAAALSRMQREGMVREITGRKRDKLFSYGAYVDLLAQGTEPL